jgi:hypothetical protein
MDIRAVNEAFNEALEEIGEDGQQTFSMEFVLHHEQETQNRLMLYRRQNNYQNLGFLFLLGGLVLAMRRGWIKLSLGTWSNNIFLALGVLWLLIALNSLLVNRRNKKIAVLEKQLLLIFVYKKILAKKNDPPAL